jgi:hypothetical protein
MDGASVAEHDGGFLAADLAEGFAVRDDHGGMVFLIRQKFCVNLSDECRKGKTVAPIGPGRASPTGGLEIRASSVFHGNRSRIVK